MLNTSLVDKFIDTTLDVMKEITWQPPTLLYPPANKTRQKRIEDAYLNFINPSSIGIDVIGYDSTTLPPMEYMISTELSNPHGGTRKRLRAIARIKAHEDARQEFIKEELANLDGRTRKEARIEAEFKWKEMQRKEMAQSRQLQWVKRGGRARLLRRRERELRKEKRQLQKLRDLRLLPATNQVIPHPQVIPEPTVTL